MFNWGVLPPVTKAPKLFIYTALAWLWIGGIFGLALLVFQGAETGSQNEYYRTMTAHGIIMTMPGLFQLMVGLSLLRAGLCMGKPVGGVLVYSLYASLNAGSLLLAIAVLALGVRVSYTLMYPLPAAGANLGLWGVNGLLIALLGLVIVLASMVVLYPLTLAKLLFTGSPRADLQLERARYRGLLDPSMLGMIAYIAMVAPTGAPIIATITVILLYLLGAVGGGWITGFLSALNFNYMFWMFAHTLMEAMGVMAIATIYFLVPIYTRAGIKLFSWSMGSLAIILYAIASPLAFFHHLYTMVSTQALGLSYTGQVTSWLTGLAGSLTLFNILATGAAYGYVLRPPLLAAIIALMIYMADGFAALELGTIGWNLKLHGTLYVTGHLMTILIAVMLSWIAAFLHHFPVLTGRALSDRLSTIGIVLVASSALGFLASFLYSGALGVPRRFYPWGSEFTVLSLIPPAVALTVAGIVLVINLLKSKPLPRELLEKIYNIKI